MIELLVSIIIGVIIGALLSKLVFHFRVKKHDKKFRQFIEENRW